MLKRPGPPWSRRVRVALAAATVLAVAGVTVYALDHSARRELAEFERRLDDEEAALAGKAELPAPVPSQVSSGIDAIVERVPHGHGKLPPGISKRIAEGAPLTPADAAELEAMAPLVEQLTTLLRTQQGDRPEPGYFHGAAAGALVLHAAVAFAGERKLEASREAGTALLADALTLAVERSSGRTFFGALLGASMLETSVTQIERLFTRLDGERLRARLAKLEFPSNAELLARERRMTLREVIRQGDHTFSADEGPRLFVPPFRRRTLVAALHVNERFFELARASVVGSAVDIPRCEEAWEAAAAEVYAVKLVAPPICPHLGRVDRARAALERLRSRVGSG